MFIFDGNLDFLQDTKLINVSKLEM
ncbi:MAG: hypothetical protein ACK4N5_17185, partial [Myxococcales bacterium]